MYTITIIDEHANSDIKSLDVQINPGDPVDFNKIISKSDIELNSTREYYGLSSLYDNGILGRNYIIGTSSSEISVVVNTTKQFYKAYKISEYANKNNCFVPEGAYISYEYWMSPDFEFSSSGVFVGTNWAVTEGDKTHYARGEGDYIKKSPKGQWNKMDIKLRHNFIEGYKLHDFSFLVRGCTGEFKFRNLKIEKGNKSTPWTPAPEDIVLQEYPEVQEVEYVLQLNLIYYDIIPDNSEIILYLLSTPKIISINYNFTNLPFTPKMTYQTSYGTSQLISPPKDHELCDSPYSFKNWMSYKDSRLEIPQLYGSRSVVSVLGIGLSSDPFLLYYVESPTVGLLGGIFYESSPSAPDEVYVNTIIVSPTTPSTLYREDLSSKEIKRASQISEITHGGRTYKYIASSELKKVNHVPGFYDEGDFSWLGRLNIGVVSRRSNKIYSISNNYDEVAKDLLSSYYEGISSPNDFYSNSLRNLEIYPKLVVNNNIYIKKSAHWTKFIRYTKQGGSWNSNYTYYKSNSKWVNQDLQVVLGVQYNDQPVNYYNISCNTYTISDLFLKYYLDKYLITTYISYKFNDKIVNNPEGKVYKQSVLKINTRPTNIVGRYLSTQVTKFILEDYEKDLISVNHQLINPGINDPGDIILSIIDNNSQKVLASSLSSSQKDYITEKVISPIKLYCQRVSVSKTPNDLQDHKLTMYYQVQYYGEKITDLSHTIISMKGQFTDHSKPITIVLRYYNIKINKFITHQLTISSRESDDLGVSLYDILNTPGISDEGVLEVEGENTGSSVNSFELPYTKLPYTIENPKGGFMSFLILYNNSSI